LDRLAAELSLLFASESADIIAINVQEIDETASLIDGNAPEKMDFLLSQLLISFPKTYFLAFSKNYGSVALMIYFSTTSRFKLTIQGHLAVSHSCESVTLGKASIASHISVDNGEQYVITVIGNHLECYDENYDVRNGEWRRILQEIGSQSDYIIMMGDLNYRIEMDRTKVLELIERREFATLLSRDQLERAKIENPEFAAFHEAKIEFPPTYKFDSGSSAYDTSPKQRIPSYTDRILISASRAVGAPEFVDYRMVDNRLSDHRPVRANFALPLIRTAIE
jgi:endonuclease/exonuclease/phosphatase family metal-dependent hydrolase